MAQEELFVPLTEAPPPLQLPGVPYEQLHEWITQHIHGPLGFVRGACRVIWLPHQRGWHVEGERRAPQTPPALPKRGPGGRFLKKDVEDAG